VPAATGHQTAAHPKNLSSEDSGMTKPPQARNAIWRALLHVAGIRFSKAYWERCKRHFDNRCAYCGNRIEKGSRRGHQDHATATSSSATVFHLVYACDRCNGDEKRAGGWQEFLALKCPDHLVRLARLKTIEDWFRKENAAMLDETTARTLSTARRTALAAFNTAVEELRSCHDQKAVGAEANH
jgi:hypothetical protein